MKPKNRQKSGFVAFLAPKSSKHTKRGAGRRGGASSGSILRPGGRAVVLEHRLPTGVVRPFYLAYCRHVLPRLAALVSPAAADAYRYLNHSIEAWHTSEQLARRFEAAGFTAADDDLPECIREEGVGPGGALKFDVGADVIAQARASRFSPSDTFWDTKATG